MEDIQMFKLLRKFKPVTLFSILAAASMVLAACAGAQATTVAPPPTSQAPAATQAPTQPVATNLPSTGATQAVTQPAATQAPTQAPTAAPTQAATAQVKNPDTIIEATIGGPESLDPAWEYDTASADVVINVYETLVFPKKDSTTEFVPMLATQWQVSPDGKTYTFDIRKGVKFQQGQDLTPEDVAYSFWRGMIQDRAGGPQWIMLQPFFGLDVQSFQDGVVTKQFNGDFAAACNAVEKAVTYDNNAGTVTLNLKQPYGPMLQILSGTWAAVVSKSWVAQQGGWDGNCADAQKYHDPSAEQDPLFKVMNGTGPYMLTNWVPEQETDLTANPNYWVTTPLWDGGPSGVAKTKNVVIKVIPEWGTRFATFQTGDADINYVPTQYISQVDPLVKNACDASGNCTVTNPQGSLTLWKGLPSVQETAIYMTENVNVTGGVPSAMGSGKLDGNGIPANFFGDINVRKAFNYCFDWNTYIQQVFNGEAVQAYGPIIQGELGYDPNQAHYTFDLTKCADSFKASTLQSADGKSLWDTGFYVQYIYNTGNDQRKTAGDILAADLLKVNPKFHMEVVGEPFALELKDQVAGRLPIFMLGWLEDYHDPNDWVVPFLASGGAYSASQAFPADVQKQMDTLIAQGVSTTDSQQRAQIYSQLQNISYENALDIFVVQPQVRVYMQDWVQGYYYNPIFSNAEYYYYSLSK
jgi:peptide/nickel transport system substrate-binding protein